MSSVTRARKGNVVVWDNADGSESKGVAIEFRSDSLLAAVLDRYGKRALSLYVVPFASVKATTTQELTYMPRGQAYVRNPNR